MEMRAHTHLFVEQFYCGMSTVYEVSDLVAFVCHDIGTNPSLGVKVLEWYEHSKG